MTRPDPAELASLLDGWLDDGCHHYPLKVQYEDTDLAGIVYHAQYLAFAERGRSAMLRCAGIDQNAMRDDGMVFAIRRITIDYRAPSQLGEALAVQTRLKALRGALMVLDQAVLGDDQTPRASLEVEVAVLALDRGPVRLPEPIRDRIAATIC